MRIYKYELELLEHQTVKMPPMSSVLKVQFQNGLLQAWARVDETLEPTEEVDFWVVGTGSPMPEMKCDAMYVDTVFQDFMVWHVFSGPCYD